MLQRRQALSGGQFIRRIVLRQSLCLSWEQGRKDAAAMRAAPASFAAAFPTGTPGMPNVGLAMAWRSA
jgi:hypothetical protein